MGRKPSLTKQISEALGTEDKRVQLKNIEQMKQFSQVPPVAVTVLYSVAGTEVSVNAPVQITAEQVKIILNKGVDEITGAIVRAQLEREEAGQNDNPEFPPEEMEELDEPVKIPA